MGWERCTGGLQVRVLLRWAANPGQPASCCCCSGKQLLTPLTVQSRLQLRHAAAVLLRRSKHAACAWGVAGAGPSWV